MSSVQERQHEGRTLRMMVWIPIVALVIVDAGYLAVIRNQGSLPPDVLTVPFVSGFMGLMAALLAISLLDHPIAIRLRPALRGGAAAGSCLEC